VWTRHDYSNAPQSTLNRSNTQCSWSDILLIKFLDVKCVYFDGATCISNWNQHSNTHGLPGTMNPHCSNILLSYYSPLIQRSLLNCNKEWAHYKQYRHFNRYKHPQNSTFTLSKHCTQRLWHFVCKTTKVNWCKLAVQICDFIILLPIRDFSALMRGEIHWHLFEYKYPDLNGLNIYLVFSTNPADCHPPHNIHSLHSHANHKRCIYPQNTWSIMQNVCC